ncbi:MAG TPA: hypothetical protein VLL54_13850 [Pyrinomonadaceae bacterium]|nr:hypothetical protein [Pyrinomonadaceae bacterium]
MKYTKFSLVALLALTLVLLASSIVPVGFAATQNQSTSLERGYRTGYSDGYNAGTRDVADNAARDYRNKEDYQKADRSYNEAWGTIEDYRDGYQQGFEAGYAAGYDRRNFDSSIPTGLRTRGTTDPGTNTSTDNSQTSDPNNSGQANNNPPPSTPVFLARDAVLLVELNSSLSSDASQRNDRFEARVVEPQEFAGAIVEGRVSRVKRAGKVKGSSELQLSFERIRMPDGRTTGFNAEVVELVNTGSRDAAGTVDEEGGVKGRSSTKDDVARVGAAAGVGAVIGAIIGGGKGAAIGAAIGGGAGAGSVFTKRGEDVRLSQGQQMRIRTSTETRIEQASN